MVQSPTAPSTRRATPPDAYPTAKSQQGTTGSNLLPYLANIIETFVGRDFWSTIEGDAAVTLAYRELATRRESNDAQPYATFLLNALSLIASTSASLDAVDDDHAALFDSATHHIARGDFRNEARTPDWVAVQVPLRELRQVVHESTALVESGDKLVVKPLSQAQGWPRIAGVGLVQGARSSRQRECDADDADVDEDEGDREDKLYPILMTLKSYRPDLPNVHGCELYPSGWLRVAHVNAEGFTASPRPDYLEGCEQPTMKEELPHWLAHVLSVLRAITDRDQTITARLPSPYDDFVRYDVTSGSRTVCVTPAMAAKPPGRMTWVGFEIGGDTDALDSVCKEPCVGVVKISYQNNEGRWKEGELLDTVHADGWLPGVVRHVYWERDEDAKVGDLTLPDTDLTRLVRVVRVKETLHHRSVGDPLSQCTTPLQMLKVAYDATETHLQLLKRKVIHRDLSWYNILCNPWHNPRTLDDKKPLAGIPCIDYILTGDATKEPCCLIADFDHAKKIPDIYKPGDKGRRERTATPMFSALEISTDKPLLRNVNVFKLRNLVPKFRAVERLPVFRRAFPDDDGGFVTMFEKVLALEFERAARINDDSAKDDEKLRAIKFTHPDTVVHDPCYDVQSIYWSLLWFFVRTLPEGQEPLDVLDGDFSTFANTLLTHKIGGSETDRMKNFFQWDGPDDYLHPHLVHFTTLFRDLALYLAVPWHMYKNHPDVTLPEDHAHTAMRCLLLAEIYVLTHTKKMYNVALDPTQPRIIHTIHNHFTLGLPLLWMAPKRKAEVAELDERDADAKRHRVQGDDKFGGALVASETTVGKAVLGHRCYERGCLPQSAGARAEKLRDDRYLFFGVGVRKPLPR